MKNREEAIKYVRKIIGGTFDRGTLPDELKSGTAKGYWDDLRFEYGMHFGAIKAAMDLYDLTLDDLNLVLDDEGAHLGNRIDKPVMELIEYIQTRGLRTVYKQGRTEDVPDNSRQVTVAAWATEDEALRESLRRELEQAVDTVMSKEGGC